MLGCLITVYDLIRNRRLGFAMDITAKVKFGTADIDKGWVPARTISRCRPTFWDVGLQVMRYLPALR
jgi:hypothetical protein